MVCPRPQRLVVLLLLAAAATCGHARPLGDKAPLVVAQARRWALLHAPLCCVQRLTMSHFCREQAAPLHGLSAAWYWFKTHWALILVAILFTACFLLTCLAVVQHTQLVCALCLLKASIAVLCCCFPRIQAWFEEQMAAADRQATPGADRQPGGPSVGLTPRPVADEYTPLHASVKAL